MEVFWAKVVPTTPRILMIHGKNLWQGSPNQDGSPVLTAKNSVGAEIRLEYFSDKSDSEGNFGTDRCIQYFIPKDFADQGETLDIEVHQGDSVERTTARMPKTYEGAPPWPFGEVLSKVVKIDRVYDLEGRTLTPSPDFSHPWLIELSSGGGLINGRIQIPEYLDSRNDQDPEGRDRANPAWGIFVNTTEPCHFENLIFNIERRDGAGIFARIMHNSFVGNCDVVADRGLDAQPNGQHSNNILFQNSYTSFTKHSGACGRLWSGEATLNYMPEFGNMDRGFTATQSGPPQFRNLIYRPRYHRMGSTVGGSESILWECVGGRPRQAQIIGQLVLTRDSAGELDNLNLKIGYFVIDCATKEWRRIVMFSRTGEGSEEQVNIVLDKPFPYENQERRVFIGNACIQNSIIHPEANSGCRAIFYFGRSIDNFIGGGDIRDFHDVVTTITRDKTFPNGKHTYSFCHGLRVERLRFTGETRAIWDIGEDDLSKPHEYLPWYKTLDMK